MAVYPVFESFDISPLQSRYYSEFYRCSRCDRIYWEGSHVEHMSGVIHQLLER